MFFNYQDTQKFKLRSRRAMYWSIINKDIELKVKSYDLCKKYQSAKSKELMTPSETLDGRPRYFSLITRMLYCWQAIFPSM